MVTKNTGQQNSKQSSRQGCQEAKQKQTQALCAEPGNHQNERNKMSKIRYTKKTNGLTIRVTDTAQVEVFEHQADGSIVELDPETWSETTIDLARATYLEMMSLVPNDPYEVTERFTAEILTRFEYQLHDLISVKDHPDLAEKISKVEHEIRKLQRYCEDHQGHGPRLKLIRENEQESKKTNDKMEF